MNWNLLMMYTVDVLVKPFWVQDPMSPIENKILNDEVEQYLGRHFFPAGASPKEGLIWPDQT